MEGHLQRELGDNLRDYRQERNLSQEVLADRLGVHRTYLGGMERGERNLTLRSVERLADRLGLAPLDLLGRPGPEPGGGGVTGLRRGAGKPFRY